MRKRRITLLGVLLRKISNHWGAMWRMHRRFNVAGKFVGWPLAVALSSIAMFFPAAMHFVFESFLYLFGWKMENRRIVDGPMRSQFRRNLVKITEIMDEKRLATMKQELDRRAAARQQCRDFERKLAMA